MNTTLKKSISKRHTRRTIGRLSRRQKTLIFENIPETENEIDNSLKICIIIPHRNRIEQLKTIINILKKKKNIDIYIIDQNNADKFNRGLLLNIGFYISSHITKKKYDRYIFHDVDSYPDNILLNKAYFADAHKYKKIHYASPFLGYKYKYSSFFGGVVGFDYNSFIKINGFPNNIFGWGIEDDILRERLLLTSTDNIIYRPNKGSYELPEHDSPEKYELSFKDKTDKIKKLQNNTKNYKNNGLSQLSNLFISVVECKNFNDFVDKYNVHNIYLNYSFIDDFVKEGADGAAAIDTQQIHYYKIDFIAEHLINKTGEKYSNLFTKDDIKKELSMKLKRFSGSPVFYNNNNKSPYYSYIKPLLYWDEIQEQIIDTYTKPKKNKNIINTAHSEIFKSLLTPQFENFNISFTKTDLKNTLKFIFDNMTEILFFRIRDGVLTSSFHINNVNAAPVFDWYKELKWQTDTRDAIKNVQNFVEYTKNPYYLTLLKPYFNRANNCLLGFENTDYIRELKYSYVKEFKEMIEMTISKYPVPDVDILINRKDFPYLRKDGLYPYEHLTDEKALKYPKKIYPIACQSKKDINLDILIPSADEWNEIKAKYSGAGARASSSSTTPNIKWNSKKDVVLFRGSSTGCGTDIQTNPRLKMAFISKKWQSQNNKKDFIDIAISKLTKRYKAFNKKVDFINPLLFKDLIGRFIKSEEQTKYKYIMNIAGNAQAYRLPTEFYKGSLIINMDSGFKMWFEPLLVDKGNYIKLHDYKNIDKQEEELFELVKWLKKNDAEAKEIADNGVKFAKEYINKESICEYLYSFMCILNKMSS